MEKLNLIYQTNLDLYEFEYINKYLFSEFDLNIIYDNKNYHSILDNSVIIYSHNFENVDNEFISYLDKFIENEYSFYLLHLSNENLSHNFTYYSKAKHVFRNYFDEKITSENCSYLPLGFKNGFLSEDKIQKVSPEKKFEFVFIGQPKSDRFDLIEKLENFDKTFIHKTLNWNCRTSLSVPECKNIYNETKFVPCPMGFIHPDSFRIMESLESKSIPIVKKYGDAKYFYEVWGENPLPIINEWSELSNFYNISEENYSKLYNEVYTWYEKFRENLPKKIKNIILKK